MRTEEWKQNENHIRQGRTQLSLTAIAASVFLVLPILVQLAMSLFFALLFQLTGGFVDLFGDTAILVVSSISMYFISFPAVALIFYFIPKWGSTGKEVWGMGKVCFCLVLSMGLGFGGGIIAQILSDLGMAGADAGKMTDYMTNVSLWASILFTVILGPMVEELFYRKLILDRILGFGELPAILLSAAMFALAHGNLAQFFYAFGLGVLWGYVYAKTGRIGYTISMHMIFNFLGGVVPTKLPEIFSTLYGLGMAVCFLMIPLLLIPARKKIHFEKPEKPFDGAGLFKAIVKNPGVIAYLLLCAVFFWYNA